MKIKKKISIFICIFLILNLTIKNLYSETPLYILNAIKLTYKDNNKIIIAEGEASAKDKSGKEIYSDFIIYDKVNNLIKTKSNSKYKDTKGNEIDADDFFYDLNIKKIKAINNVKYKEKNGNTFLFSEFEYFENSSKGFGKNAKGFMNDKSSLEGNYLQIDNNLGTAVVNSSQKKINFLEKIKILFTNENKYTTCENIDNASSIEKQCPDWSISTFKTKHDTNKKKVTHNHAIIKIRNIPIFYTPYFSHPDPTVHRKSGFLPASTKNFTNLGRTFKTPYFWAVNDNSDITFTPIFYTDENHIYLTEYRKQNLNSSLILDSSYSSGYKNLNKKSENGTSLNRTGGSRNHIFLNFNGQYNNNLLFGNNDVNFQIQRISQKNYLNVNQINTDLVEQDKYKLLNKLSINSYKDNERIYLGTSVLENLRVDDSNSKYHYILPSIQYDNFFNKFNNNISLSSFLDAQNYSGDTKKITQRNTLSLETEPKIIKQIGISNVIKAKGSNLNFYNENVPEAKENMNGELYSTIGLETSLPLIRIGKTIEETLSPKIFIKHTTGSMNDESRIRKVLTFGDIYSMDRLNNIDNPETGNSLGYGLNYEINKKNTENINIIKSSLGIGQVLTDVKNSKMPRLSSLNEKSSNVVGNFNLLIDKIVFKDQNDNYLDKEHISKRIPEGLNFDYDFSLSNDLNKILKNEISTTFKDNANLFTLNYYQLDDPIVGKAKIIDTTIKRSFENNLNFLLGTRKNLELSYTESNFIETNYESDCLKIGINLSKKFYEDDDIKKSNNLTLFITFKPFGQPIAPDLTNFINN